MYKEDIIEKLIKKKRKELLRKSEGFVGSAYVERELTYNETWLPEPYILSASTDHGTVTAEKYASEKEAEADYQSLRDKYNLKVSTPQK